MKTKQIFKNLNQNLILTLIPSKDLPIYGNSFTNPKDIAFEHPFKLCGLKANQK